MLEADQIVSLTHLAKEEILKWDLPGKDKLKIEVIPCCADLSHFERGKVTAEQQSQLREKLRLDPVISSSPIWVRSGTWYMLPEMLAFSFSC